MKATLEFDLENVDDQRSYKLCNNSQDMNFFIFDLGQKLRSWAKYGCPFKTAEEAIEAIREEYYSLLNYYNVELD
jgi:hypothetical protein